MGHAHPRQATVGVAATPDDRPHALARAWRCMSRNARHLWLRVRFPGAEWGARLDVRSGFSLLLARTARLGIGDGVVIDRFATLECRGSLTVGAHTVFGHHCTVAANEDIRIGDNCLIAEMVSIRDHDHRFEDLDVPIRLQGSVCSPVRIGNNVWIGAKATVLKGVTIGDNAIIGANAVVTHDIPACAIAVGVPARVIRTRQ